MWRIVTVAILLTGCAKPLMPNLPSDVQQAIVVRPAGGSTKVVVTAYELRGGNWTIALPERPGVIGRAGFADLGQKREGDGKTPMGVYPLRRAFGYAESLATGLEYRQATASDFWIDDPKSPDYNRWISGRRPEVSHEVLRRDDDYYKLAAVVEYNTDPIIAGHGSAIFLHIWAGPESSTAGCVALAEPDVAALLKWLDRAKNPVIVLGHPSATVHQ
ncbi:MAG: L,D-transpeptidase family protein [Gemmataceae bacterium]